MKNLLVLDKLEYERNNEKYMACMKESLLGDNCILYTSYEDDLIRKVRNNKMFGSALQHIFYWIKSYRYARKIRKEKYNVIYCINPIVGVFLGLFNRKSKIVLCGFLFEQKKNKLYYEIRKYITRLMLKGIEKIVVYGKKEVSYYKKIFPNSEFVFIKYGIDYDNKSVYKSEKLPDKYMFSGGGSNRDYKTLIDAYNISHKNSKLIIATQPWRVEKYDIHDITVLGDVVTENFGSVLGKSDCLILSLKDADISTGHMVMFQAMNLGVPIIVNDIPAIRDYVDESCVTFYETENYKELAEIIDKYSENYNDFKEKACRSIELYYRDLTFEGFVKRVIRL